MIKILRNCFSGFYQILQSLSGTFGLLCLVVGGFITYKCPAVGGVALAALFTAAPLILAYAEHKEFLAQLQGNVPSPAPPVPPAPPCDPAPPIPPPDQPPSIMTTVDAVRAQL